MKKNVLILLFGLLSLSIRAQYAENFENWHSLMGNLTIPNGWNASDSLMKYFGALTNPGATFQAQVEKENPGHGGTGALKVITKTHPGLPTILPAGLAPCLASNSRVNVNTTTGEFSFIGGTPYTLNPTHATMWVKNNVVGGDTTAITILVIDNSDGGDSIVAYADTLLGANINSFTQLNLPFKYNPTPGFTPLLLRVIVQSSANFYFDTLGAFAGLNDGTYISVDDINVVAPAGMTTLYSSHQLATVYPSHMQEELRVEFAEQVPEGARLDLFDLNGKLLRSVQLSQPKTNLKVDALPAGIYAYRISGREGVLQQGKVQK